MSRSSLWVMNAEYYGTEVKEYGNSWLVTPVAWDILLNKYLPCAEKRHFLSASMFDKTLSKRLNQKINESPVQADRVLWEMGNQQVFFTKDKEFVADCVANFLTVNAEAAAELGEHIHERFAEVAVDIRAIDGEKFPNFIWKNTSVDDGVEYWFHEHDEEFEERPKSLREWGEFLTEFVIVDEGKIVDFKSNLKYFGKQAEVADNV